MKLQTGAVFQLLGTWREELWENVYLLGTFVF